MKLYLVLFMILLDFGDPTLLFYEKVPIFYCLKVCPLYCSKREKRDVDFSPIDWVDDEYPYPPYTEDHYVPFHGYIIKHWKMTTTTKKPTTTEKTTTTTQATTAKPTFICAVCINKCGIPT